MTVALIGSGNVATHLAKALNQAGHKVTQVFSRSLANANELADKVNAKPLDDLSRLEDAEIYLISVSDDAIDTVISQLSQKNGIVLHTSGSTGIDVFEGQFQNYGVLYPIQTFSKQKEIDFRQVPITIEANSGENLSIIKELAISLSDDVMELSSRQRLALHVSAVFACNFSNYLYSVAEEILEKENISFDLLKPLIVETADKIKNHQPKDVQTGPAIRGDHRTIKKHIAYLEDYSDHKKLYEQLSEGIFKYRDS